MVVFTWANGGLVKLYVGGVSVGTPVYLDTLDPSVFGGVTALLLGYAGTFGNFWMRKLGLWTRDLSDDEITELSGGGVFPF
jgi:hypothetical protein